jgi:cytochrome P450
VHWYEPGPFWCVTRHADVQRVSRSPRVFRSGHGTQIFQIPLVLEGAPAGVEGLAKSIIQMDPPEHNRHRKRVIRAFTPRMVRALEPRIREITVESLAQIPPGESVDFVEAVSTPLSMLVIAEMLGVPGEDREDFRRWSDVMIEAGGGGVSEATVTTVAELFAYFGDKLRERRRRPRGDLLSALGAAEIDGEKLSEAQILMFCLTLLVAGNETTRNLISGGARALLEHPEQKRRLIDDPGLIPNAVEEMLRWVTPVRNFARRATRDTELGGRRIAEGDFAVLFYGSANRDEAVFGPEADRFDVAREDAARHVAFGFGEHLCMGASLARLETRVMFEELLARLPHFEPAGPVEPLRSTVINGVERMPVVFKA